MGQRKYSSYSTYLQPIKEPADAIMDDNLRKKERG